MTMRRTPYLRLRYPWTDDVVNAADVQSMASDIDQALVATATMAANFSDFASVAVSRSTTQSIPKGTLTAISFDTVVLNNGANSPLSNGSWYSSGTPTRVTAPVACVVLATAFAGINLGSALGTSGGFQVTIGRNGSVVAPDVQGSKWGPISTVTGQQWTSATSMWKLVAGDYLELKLYWTGTPAGPFNSDNILPPSLAVMMLALPAVP